ncbi:unnamed protein product [Rotaria socialis]|uniref:Transposase n=1 Tax=Rotaria socialis TaxID=392032 RepID=A0A820RBW9_9BILA|nr:unnamed protein product [Rotaria socialis]
MSGSFRLSSSERIEVVKWYAIYQNAAEFVRQFPHRFDRDPPTRKVILDLVRKFDKTGSVEDVARPGRSRSVTTAMSRERVRLNFQQNPESSTRRATVELNLSRTSLRRMMKRCEFADTFLNLIAADSSFLNRIVWSDEAIFKLNGHVNRHNCVYYGMENPLVVITEEMNALRITVWAGIWSGGIIGPFFFYGNVTADNYLDMLEENIVPAIEKEMNLDETFYMHDGAPAHYARSVRQFLEDTFPDRWIGRRGWIEWPARSPDLTPTDFFLWSVIKDRVYAIRPPNLQTLEDAIITDMRFKTYQRSYVALLVSQCSRGFSFAKI